jgi:hypothetical protein
VRATESGNGRRLLGDTAVSHFCSVSAVQVTNNKLACFPLTTIFKTL